MRTRCTQGLFHAARFTRQWLRQAGGAAIESLGPRTPLHGRSNCVGTTLELDFSLVRPHMKRGNSSVGTSAHVTRIHCDWCSSQTRHVLHWILKNGGGGRRSWDRTPCKNIWRASMTCLGFCQGGRPAHHGQGAKRPLCSSGQGARDCPLIAFGSHMTSCA